MELWDKYSNFFALRSYNSEVNFTTVPNRMELQLPKVVAHSITHLNRFLPPHFLPHSHSLWGSPWGHLPHKLLALKSWWQLHSVVIQSLNKAKVLKREYIWIRAGSGHTGRKPSILVSLKQRYKFMWHNGKCSWKYSFGPEHLVGKKRHQLPERGRRGESLKSCLETLG